MTKPCGIPVVKGSANSAEDKHSGWVCTYPRMAGKRRCVWHWLLAQDAETQRSYAEERLRKYREGGFPDRPRRPPAEWPEGERWCAGCQDYIPLFYTSGSRCKSCASTAAHRAMVSKVYGLEDGEYDALFRLQGGRCFICQRKSPSRRLAVDHDHQTGEVRGLLCPDPERGCNHAILGPLEASPGGALAAAKRMVMYLELTPYQRLKSGETLTWDEYVAQRAQERVVGALRVDPPALGQAPPF